MSKQKVCRLLTSTLQSISQTTLSRLGNRSTGALEQHTTEHHQTPRLPEGQWGTSGDGADNGEVPQEHDGPGE